MAEPTAEERAAWWFTWAVWVGLHVEHDPWLDEPLTPEEQAAVDAAAGEDTIPWD